MVRKAFFIQPLPNSVIHNGGKKCYSRQKGNGQQLVSVFLLASRQHADRCHLQSVPVVTGRTFSNSVQTNYMLIGKGTRGKKSWGYCHPHLSIAGLELVYRL